MANLLVEGFDWFPSGLSTSERSRLLAADDFFEYDGIFLVPNVRTGRFGFGKALSFLDGAADGTARKNGYVVPIYATPSDGFIGASLYRGSSTTGTQRPGLGAFDAVSGVLQVFVEFSEYGVIKVWRGFPASGILLASSAAGSFEENQWFNAEIRPVISDTVGGVEVRINTVPKVQLVSADTQASALSVFDSIWLGYDHVATASPFIDFAIDDLFVNDTTGAVDNDWAGNLRVKTQFMTANGATDNFSIGGTSPAASNWQSVLNQSIDDTKFVYSPNVGDLDLYVPDPNLNAPLVRVVQVRAALRQDDATQRSAKMVLRIGGVNYVNSAESFTNQTFTFYKQRWEKSPATGVTFTGTEVNGLQAGIKVQS